MNNYFLVIVKCVLVQIIYSISDKPFLSRARATLPEGYLIISKQKDGLNAYYTIIGNSFDGLFL